jgi:hypothetical protein
LLSAAGAVYTVTAQVKNNFRVTRTALYSPR